MKTLKQGFNLIKYNISSIFLFEILYKLMTTAVLTPVLYAMLMYSLKLADIDYLNVKNIANYFESPFTYILLFLMLLIASAYALMHMSALIYAYDASYKHRKTNPIVMFVKAFFNSLRVIRPKNLMFGVYVLFVLPFTHTVIISASLAGIRIPEYLRDYIIKNKFLLGIVIVSYGALSVFAMLRIFSFNFFTLHRTSYKTSIEKSKKHIKGSTFKVLAGVILLNVLISILLFSLEWVVVYGTAKVLRNILPYKTFGFVIHTVIQVSFLVLYIIFSIISTPVICAFISASFYGLNEKNAEAEAAYNEEDNRVYELTHKKRSIVISALVILSGIVLNGLYLYLDLNNRYKLNFLYDKVPEITAHRGDSAHAPENTMVAIRLAVENQADIVEIDVRQTRDGVFVLSHDESLKRTAGYNDKVGNLDYEFVAGLDVGARYSDAYAGERIPTLDEVLLYASDEEIFLNIELKTAGTDKNYVEGVLSLIEKYEYEESCVVASQDYNVLTQVKSLKPEIKTVYIVTMAIGDLGDMEYADVYSVKYNFVTASMVRRAHRYGKQVYAWTINNEEVIRNMMLMDVDSIITNKPYYTKKIVYDENENFMTGLLKSLLMEY